MLADDKPANARGTLEYDDAGKAKNVTVLSGGTLLRAVAEQQVEVSRQKSLWLS